VIRLLQPVALTLLTHGLPAAMETASTWLQMAAVRVPSLRVTLPRFAAAGILTAAVVCRGLLATASVHCIVEMPNIAPFRQLVAQPEAIIEVTSSSCAVHANIHDENLPDS